MKRYIRANQNDAIYCMSNVRGSKVSTPYKLPFSFYFSGRNSSHDIRVKPIFNPDRMIASKAGTLELHGDWVYTPGEDDYNVKPKDIAAMKNFFRRYIVLFAAVWDFQLSDPVVQDYFEGDCSLSDVIKDLEFYDEFNDELDEITTIEELESFCRLNDLVNFYGN